MYAVIFETPGLIDLRAFTVLGANAKPNSTSPIGYFGTGLKYAIAVLVRNKIPVTLWRGKEKYSFHLQDTEFRDSHLELIEMRRSKGLWNAKTELPYTTEFGKNWKLWQVFRELYTNTLDENGCTTSVNDTSCVVEDFIYQCTSHDKTVLIVEGEKFFEEYQDRDRTFLPEAIETRNDDHPRLLEYFPRPSEHVYYRGMRVMDLPKPALMTYNFLKRIDLTEDRTAMYPYSLESDIRSYIAGSDEPILIDAVITANKGVYEARVDFDDSYSAPSETFTKRVHKLQKTTNISSSAKKLVKRYDPDAEPELYYAWLPDLINAIEDGSWDNAQELLEEHQETVVEILNNFDNTK